MRKRILLLPVLAAALLVISASTAQAGAFILTLSDGINAPVVVQDLTLVSSPDQVMFSGTIGSFLVTSAVGFTSYPGATGAPVQMNFSSLMVRNTSSTAGTFTATLWRSGLSASTLGLGSTVVGLGSASATGGNATFTSYINPNNGTGGDVVFSSSIPGGPLNATSGPVNLVSGQEFAIQTTITLNFTGSGQINASSGLQVRDASVPEPTTLLLFGPGLIGLAALRRRRRSKGL